MWYELTGIRYEYGIPQLFMSSSSKSRMYEGNAEFDLIMMRK